MPRRKTREEFVMDLEKKNDSIVVIGDYVNSNTPISVKCSKCGHTWSATPKALLRGSGCRECFYKSRIMPKEEFEKALAEKCQDIELVGEYKKASSTTTFRCKVCGYQWCATPSHVLAYPNCWLCSIKRRSKSRRITQERFEAAVKKAHPDYEILSTYQGYEKPIDVRCNKCGRKWTANRAGQLLARSECLGCSRIRRRKSDQEFRIELSDINKYVEPIDTYLNNSTKIRFRCLKCGEIWEAVPTSVLRGTGCPHCTNGCGSFFEYVLLYALRQSLGDDNVISRDRDAIGYELDIYIPSLSLAYEPGSWFYHKDRVDRDLEKRAACENANIELVTLYYGVPDNTSVPTWCISEKSYLGFIEWERAVVVAKQLLKSANIDVSSIDWGRVRSKALRNSGRKTTRRFSDELASVNPSIAVLGEYRSGSEHIDVECRVCGHKWSARPHNLLSGRGCPNCRDLATSARTRMSEQEFLRRMSEKNPHVKVLGRYSGSKEKVLVQCVYCMKKWEAQASNLLQGKACSSCSRKKSNEYFVERVKSIHPNIKVLTQYDGVHNPVTVTCERCGRTWSTTPQRLYSGDGCQGCSWLENGKKQRKSDETFREQLAERQPTIELVGTYTRAHDKAEFHCKICGDTWLAAPANILRDRGCPTCGRRRTARAKALDHDKFTKRVQERHPYLELVTKYVDRNTKVTVRCTKCGGTRTVSPDYLLSRKGGCPKCRCAGR